VGKRLTTRDGWKEPKCHNFIMIRQFPLSIEGMGDDGRVCDGNNAPPKKKKKGNKTKKKQPKQMEKNTESGE
jgi:hypothetical protein